MLQSNSSYNFLFICFLDLNLTILTARPETPAETLPSGSSKIEDDIAMSLLDLSKTPIHGTPTPKPAMRTSAPDFTRMDSLIGALRANVETAQTNLPKAQPMSPIVSGSGSVVSMSGQNQSSLSTMPRSCSASGKHCNSLTILTA